MVSCPMSDGQILVKRLGVAGAKRNAACVVSMARASATVGPRLRACAVKDGPIVRIVGSCFVWDISY